MQYKVPQNIDIEDKIVGPFTMKQFLYLFVGGFILYGLWNYSSQFVNQNVIFFALAIPVGLLSFCLAVIKVNDRPFEVFILNFFKFIFSPKYRKWITGFTPETVVTMDPLEAKQNKNDKVKTETDLDSLALALEQQTAEIKSKDAAKSSANQPRASKPTNLNLSVSDVENASKKQQAAQK